MSPIQKKAKKNILDFIKDDIRIIFHPFGDLTTMSYIDLIASQEILVVFPDTPENNLRDPKLTHVINFGPSYLEIDVAAIQYAMKYKNAKKFAFLYSKIPTVEKSIIEAINKSGLKKENYLLIPYKPGETDFEAQAAKFKKFKPDAIAFWSLEFAAKELIKKIGAHNLIDTILLTARISDENFRAFLTEKGLTKKLVNIENVPNPKESNMEIVKEYRKNTDQADPISLEAYICSDIFIDILKKIETPITKEKIIKNAEKIKNQKIKGFPISFNPNTRNISNHIWIEDGGNPQWIKFECK